MNRLLSLSVFMLAMVSVPATASSKTFTYCIEASPTYLNPQIGTDGATLDVAQALYNRLVDFEPGTTNLIPSLAEKWDISPDGKTYTFYLRKGVKFHKNKDFMPTRNFNADDVLFVFNRQLNKYNYFHKVSGGNYEFFLGMNMPNIIEKVEKVDTYIVKFHLKVPNAPFLANLAMDFASVSSAEYADQMLKAGTPEKVDSAPIGTGPFEFAGFQKDAYVRFRAFDDYWQGRSKLERLVFSVTPDATVRYAKLQKNECQAMPYPNPADIAKMKSEPNLQVLEKSGLNIGYITFNMDKKPLDNQKVRQALSYGVNKKAILESIYQFTGTEAKNPLPPTIWSYNNEIEGYTYDPEKAKALLKEAGFEHGFTTELWAMPVSRPYNPNARRMAEMVQADWKKIGVNAKIVSFEWGEYLKRMENGEHSAGMMGWVGDNGDPDNFLNTLLSCHAVSQGSNYAYFCHEEYDALVTQAARESDKTKRSELYKKAQVIFNEQAPWLPIAHSTTYFPIRKEVKNYIVSPFLSHNFYAVDLDDGQ